MAVSRIFWQRNLNLCGSPRSSSESRRPLDVISVCTRPGQHVTDRIGPYQPQVPGAEFGLGVRWRLALTSIGVPGHSLGVPRPSLGNPPVVVFSLGLGGVVSPRSSSGVTAVSTSADPGTQDVRKGRERWVYVFNLLAAVDLHLPLPPTRSEGWNCPAPRPPAPGSGNRMVVRLPSEMIVRLPDDVISGRGSVGCRRVVGKWQ